MIRRLAILAALGLALGIGAAQAQDGSLAPSFGTVKLTSGFEPDPYLVDMQAGGSVDASALGGNCWGYVAEAPDLKVYYSPGDLPLTFSVTSEADTTLVVQDPDGNWICDDDTGGNLNPLITINEPVAGQYAIWVGTFSQGDLSDATLEITELAPPVQSLDWSLDPNFGAISYNANVETEPYFLDMQAGGEVDAHRTLPECRGYVTVQPDFRFEYTAGAGPLVISAQSDTDTTLIVSDPNAEWICDDDSGGAANPQVTIDAPLDGQYDVWVGTYSEGPIADATLIIGGTAGGGDLNWDLTPNFGEVDLTDGFSPDPYTIDIVAGGDISAESVGDDCWGYVTAAPDFRLYYGAGASPLVFSVDSDADTTMIVADPNGDWFCNDDTNGLNPEVRFDAPLDGQYDIWVGTFFEGETSEATLSIRGSGGGAADGGDGVIDWALDPMFGDVDLESGFLPDPFIVEATAGGSIPASTVDDTCSGFVTAEPTFRLYYDAGAFPLYFWVDSTDDTTLLVSDPLGNWFCDDDGGTIPLQPALGFDNPEAGQYDIWIGRFGGGTGPASLMISETEDGRETEAMPAPEPAPDPQPMPDEPQPVPDEPIFIEPDEDAEPAPPPSSSAAMLTLAAGFSPDPTTVDVEAGGPVPASDVADDSCYGSFGSGPSVVVSYEAGAWPLILSVDSEQDTTLAVQTPDGAWLCDDDSGEDLNPSITIDAPASGDYAVWVGAYADEAAAATLYLSEVSSQ